MRLSWIMPTLVLLFTSPTKADWDFSAFEDGFWYLGGQFQYARVDSDAGDANPLAVHLLGGYQITRHFGVESRIGLGFKDDDADDDINLDIDVYFGLYGTGTVPLSDWISLYALIGVTKMEVDVGFRRDEDNHETDLSYGAGMLIRYNEDIAMSLEAMQWLDKGIYDVSGLMLGFRYEF